MVLSIAIFYLFGVVDTIIPYFSGFVKTIFKKK
nr:MAG TPA: hypothetical protein [Caudoviricetes sp.]